MYSIDVRVLCHATWGELIFLPEQAGSVVHANWELRPAGFQNAFGGQSAAIGPVVNINGKRMSLSRAGEAAASNFFIAASLRITSDLTNVLLGCRRGDLPVVVYVGDDTTIPFQDNGPDDNFEMWNFAINGVEDTSGTITKVTRTAEMDPIRRSELLRHFDAAMALTGPIARAARLGDAPSR